MVLYGTECLWNVYGHLIELMVIWWAPQRIWSQFTQTPPEPNKIESNWTWSLPCKHSNKQDELNGHEIKNRIEFYSILVLLWGWIEMNMRYNQGGKDHLKFWIDICCIVINQYWGINMSHKKVSISGTNRTHLFLERFKQNIMWQIQGYLRVSIQFSLWRAWHP